MTRLAAAPSGEPLKYHFRIDSQPLGAGALEMLLSGSHLIFRVINPKTIEICWPVSNGN